MCLIISLFTTQGRFLVLRGVYRNEYSSVHSKITQIDIFEQELSKLNFKKIIKTLMRLMRHIMTSFRNL